MNAGRADEAIAVLDRALRMVPQQEHDELNAFRGLALQVAGRNAESTRALHAAKSSGLAQAMLGTRIAGQEEI